MKLFDLENNGTTVKTEMLAGLTTFLTMAYIIFVQPAVLSGAMFGMKTGLDFGAVMTATCLSAALATAIMGLYARYPIAQAPGMGENFFFVFSILPAAGALAAVQDGTTTAWQVALGVVFVAGVIFLLLSITGIRQLLMDALSPNMKSAIAVGIGLFIAFIGLQNAGFIQANSGTLVAMRNGLATPDMLIFFIGLFATSALYVRRVRGAIIWGILITTLLTILLRFLIPLCPASISASKAVTDSKLMTLFKPASAVVSLPPAIAPTLLKMDVVRAVSFRMLPFIVIILFMDVFDTIGTLIGVSKQAGFIKDNKLPRARQAMLSDATGTVVGACLGTSTVTSFIESVTGVEQGGRTGLTALTTAALFLLALFFSPLVGMVGSYPVITAPALVIVGSMVLQNVRHIDWGDHSESIPAFLTMLGIPLTYSIGNGLAIGFISYPIIKLLSGRGRQVTWLMYVMAVVVLLYLIFLRV